MSDQIKYALNKVSGVVERIDADLLAHPVLGANLIEVDEPDSCISCGIQPTEVTTKGGDEIILKEPNEGASTKPATSTKPAKEAKNG